MTTTTNKTVKFYWRKEGDSLNGYTLVAGRETCIFEIFRRVTRFRRPNPIRLVRGGGGIEDFKTIENARNWAEKCLSSDVEILRK